MQPRILAARLDSAQKRIVAAVAKMSQGRDVPPLPDHRDPQQQSLFRTEWIADRLEELQASSQPSEALTDKPKKGKVSNE